MMRLPRVFEGPWAWMACGALALLGIAALADIPSVLRGLLSRPAEQAAAPINWVADPAQYPPALLRFPDRFKPNEFGSAAVAVGQNEPAPEPSVTSRAAGYNDRGSPAEPEAKAVLRRLPDVETLPSPESGLPTGQWFDERPPDFSAPAAGGRNPQPSTVGSYMSPEFDSNRPDTASQPSTGGTFREEAPVVEFAPPSLPRPVPSRQAEQGPRPRAIARPANPQAMQAVASRANELSRHGFALAQRGALYSARAEFVQALRLVTQALDAEFGDSFHSESLAAGLLALEEANDFVPKGSDLEANLNVASVVVSHQTPVLKDATLVSPLVAVQRYYTYAQEQLAYAGGGQPAASAALYGMGRVHLALSKESVDARRLSGPKSLTLHQAALLVDPRNHRAANELGVLLARYGQLGEARRVLLVGLSTSRERETWHNLAVVHERLGETDLAKRARYEEQLLTGKTNESNDSDSLVRWVGVKEFSSTSPTADSPAPAINNATTPRTAAAVKPGDKKSSSFAWPWK